MNKENIHFYMFFAPAIYLISKKVYKDKDIKYGYNRYGEDAYFCECARNKGYKLFTDISLFQYHIMNKEILQKYLDKTLEMLYT